MFCTTCNTNTGWLFFGWCVPHAPQWGSNQVEQFMKVLVGVCLSHRGLCAFLAREMNCK